VTAAFTDDGTLFTWGNGYGLAPPTSWSMMGYPATHDQHLPKRVEALVGVTAVDIGGEHMVIVAQQTAYTCGRSGTHDMEEGRLGHVHPPGATQQMGATSIDPVAFFKMLCPDADTPRAVHNLAEEVVVAVAAGVRHTAFVTDDGRVYTCGHNCDRAAGGLGHDGRTHLVDGGCDHGGRDWTVYDDVVEPKLVEGLVGHRVVSVSITSYTTAVVTHEGRMFVFGSDWKESNEPMLHVPKERSALRGIRIVDASLGNAGVIALTSDGRQLYANGHLQVGHEGGFPHAMYCDGKPTQEWMEAVARWGAEHPARVAESERHHANTEYRACEDGWCVTGGEDGTFFTIHDAEDIPAPVAQQQQQQPQQD